MKGYFMGVPVGLTSGHYCEPADRGRTPWGDHVVPLYDHHPERDGPRHPGLQFTDRARPEEVEGEFVHLVVDGWTLIAAWDKSGDRRGGCTASFAFEGEHTGEGALQLARARWPAVLRRIDQRVAKLGHAVTVRAAVPATKPKGRRYR